MSIIRILFYVPGVEDSFIKMATLPDFEYSKNRSGFQKFRFWFSKCVYGLHSKNPSRGVSI